MLQGLVYGRKEERGREGERERDKLFVGVLFVQKYKGGDTYKTEYIFRVF